MLTALLSGVASRITVSDEAVSLSRCHNASLVILAWPRRDVSEVLRLNRNTVVLGSTHGRVVLSFASVGDRDAFFLAVRGEQKQCLWDALSPELWKRILRRCDLETWGRLSQTCCVLRDACRDERQAREMEKGLSVWAELADCDTVRFCFFCPQLIAENNILAVGNAEHYITLKYTNWNGGTSVLRDCHPPELGVSNKGGVFSRNVPFSYFERMERIHSTATLVWLCSGDQIAEWKNGKGLLTGNPGFSIDGFCLEFVEAPRVGTLIVLDVVKIDDDDAWPGNQQLLRWLVFAAAEDHIVLGGKCLLVGSKSTRRIRITIDASSTMIAPGAEYFIVLSPENTSAAAHDSRLPRIAFSLPNVPGGKIGFDDLPQVVPSRIFLPVALALPSRWAVKGASICLFSAEERVLQCHVDSFAAVFTKPKVDGETAVYGGGLMLILLPECDQSKKFVLGLLMGKKFPVVVSNAFSVSFAAPVAAQSAAQKYSD